MNAWQKCPIKTVRQAVAFKSDCIGLLAVADNNNVVRDFLNVIMAELVLFFNVGKSMTPQQISSTISLIISDPIAASLSFPDLKICFENAKKGLYGKSYDRLDGQVIFEWLNAYFAEKAALIEEANNLAHDQAKKTPADAVPDSLTKDDWMNGTYHKEKNNRISPEQWLELQNNLKELAKKSNARIDKKPSEKTEQQKLIQRFLTQFDKLWIKRDVEGNGSRFIKRNGIVMNQVEYVEYKLRQVELVKKRKK